MEREATISAIAELLTKTSDEFNRRLAYRIGEHIENGEFDDSPEPEKKRKMIDPDDSDEQNTRRIINSVPTVLMGLPDNDQWSAVARLLDSIDCLVWDTDDSDKPELTGRDCTTISRLAESARARLDAMQESANDVHRKMLAMHSKSVPDLDKAPEATAEPATDDDGKAVQA